MNMDSLRMPCPSVDHTHWDNKPLEAPGRNLQQIRQLCCAPG
eukprot:CAMPEP_0174374788 /NCGR_PEP_ID=MMETSP0811_2-20130205/112190_1 /TAXON_ID=73025 ORGANISM="Eutreptiella gymnastica-like, Strain CCMP1594" /NCGR_SAMPLE_ID=MMETSP0811_2 /ASSEMBLY_ACC=CAM_ASM_000667 /LENGTH=41 /DNA_ID= /DNA_START= /DNA_END= /DNA_ORIENTATION=